MNKTIIISIIFLILIGGGVFLFNQQQENEQNKMTNNTVNTNMKDKEKDVMVKEDGSMEKNIYNGNIIAGTTTPYITFEKADYDKALEENKIIFLNFYANWCPTCRAELPDLKSGFDTLNDENVIGFQVNYNDSETDNSEKELAKEFGITYQHTKVILKNGEKVFGPVTEGWDKEKLVNTINSFK